VGCGLILLVFEGVSMKTIFAMIFIFLFPGLVFSSGNRDFYDNDISQPSMQEQYASGYWIVRSSNNRLIVIGVSSPMTRRDSEITAAKEDAARKVAMFYGVNISMEITNRTGSGFFDYTHDPNLELTYDTNPEIYIDQLTFDPQNDVLITGEAVFVRFQHDTTIMNIDYRARMINGRPSWIRNQDMPEFDGYITAVGFAQNQRRLKDTIFKSIKDAIARIIEESSTTVNTRETITGQGSSSFIQTKSEGRLINFMVLDFWIDPETRRVYTLAIAGSGG
jgi:hypothetical protein